LYNNISSIKTVIVLIPLFNEEENVIDSVFKEINNCNYEILFINDGSTDKTLSKVKNLEARNMNISYLSFSRNFGKDVALLAGFQHISPSIDAVITMDSDLQHPPELIADLIEHWQNGYDIVYAYRQKKSTTTSGISHLSSKLFYWIVSQLADVKLENGLSDFKIIDKKVVRVIKNIKEDNPFFRGLFKWIGYNQIGIPYSAGQRLNGVSKYSTKALIRLALNSITSFSTKPLTIAIYIGFFTSLISVLYIPYVLYSLYKGYSISGWPSTIATIAFFGGIQLMVLGIIGLYLGKIFIQSKNRPQYIIDESKFTASHSSIAQNEKYKSNHFFNF
jgi:dolichol-phosphate mannosyltransferase